MQKLKTKMQQEIDNTNENALATVMGFLITS
jgi:hypothetical protein